VLRNVKLYKPIVAAVNGTCVAGGMEMLGGCDLRVAADTATFGVMEPKRGLFAGGGTTVRLPRQIPFPAAMELLLCADRISARRVYEMGLVNEVCPPGPVDGAGPRLCPAHHGQRTPGRAQDQGIGHPGLAVDMKEAYRIESAISSEVFSSEDAVEGPEGLRRKAHPRVEEPLSDGRRSGQPFDDHGVGLAPAFAHGLEPVAAAESTRVG
jgi:enoyl-CoA hydratase